MNPVSPSPSTTSARSTRVQSRRARPNRRSRAPVILALTATVLASLVLGSSIVSAESPKPTPTVGAVRSELDVALDNVVAAGVPGIIVRVQDPHRSARRFAAGVGDLVTGAALRPAAQFRIGSITKTFVATVVPQLVDEGRTGLDDSAEG